jgi:tyrosyl-tRNA synthetase
MEQHRSDPTLFTAQKALAEHVTRNVHGGSGLSRALLATRLVLGPATEESGIAERWLCAFEDTNLIVPISQHRAAQLPSINQLLVDLDFYDNIQLAEDAIKKGGAVYFLDRASMKPIKITDPLFIIRPEMFLEDRVFIIFGAGKRHPVLLQIDSQLQDVELASLAG